MPASSRLLTLTALGASLAGAAAAQQTEADRLRAEISALETRVDELEAGSNGAGDGGSIGNATFNTDRDGITFTFSGRVNQALLFADQGGDRDETFVIDNDASGSRFGVVGESQFGDFTAGVEFVISAEVNSSDEIDFGSTQTAADEDGTVGDFRKAEFYLKSDRFGALYFGQGDTAAEDTAHADLSGTDFAGSGSDVDDIAGGLVFVSENGTELAELDDFFDMQDGSRAIRAMYETPAFSGFSARFSLTNDGESLDGDDDIEGDGLSPAFGIGYETEFGDNEFAASASWRREDRQGDEEGDETVEDRFVVGSASLLLASGINVTLAASSGDIDGQDAETTAYFAKVGYAREFFDFGETRFSLDYFEGRNVADFAAPDGDLPQARSYGLFAVQTVSDLNTEFYIGARVYEIDDVFVEGVEEDVEDLTAVLTGARIRF